MCYEHTNGYLGAETNCQFQGTSVSIDSFIYKLLAVRFRICITGPG